MVEERGVSCSGGGEKIAWSGDLGDELDWGAGESRESSSSTGSRRAAAVGGGGVAGVGEGIAPSLTSFGGSSSSNRIS